MGSARTCRFCGGGKSVEAGLMVRVVSPKRRDQNGRIKKAVQGSMIPSRSFRERSTKSGIDSVVLFPER